MNFLEAKESKGGCAGSGRDEGLGISNTPSSVIAGTMTPSSGGRLYSGGC